jgi:hypothetical protein
MRSAIIALVIGIVLGYVIGYKDAYRGEKAIGSKLRMAAGMMSMEQIQAERQQRAQMMRDSIRSKSGLKAIDSAVSAATVP